MDRPIIGYRQDDEGHWVALLSCGHGQHIRHDPPFVERPWVTTEEGRSSRLGRELHCVRCDRFELPEAFVEYSQTPPFTEESIPAKLRRDHATKPGVWGRIVVELGRLRYHVPSLEFDADLAPNRPGIVIPEVLHHVEPDGAVRFHVEFYRAPDSPADVQAGGVTLQVQ